MKVAAVMAGRASKISLEHLLHRVNFQVSLGHDPLEPGVFLLQLPQHPHNLLFRKPPLFHSISPVILDWSYREILTLSMAQF